ncbi:MAG: YkvA family protein [Xanthobacteraceae bacterium]
MRFGYAAAGDTKRDGGVVGDEMRLRRAFWDKARQVARNLPFAEDLVAAYYCAFDRATPLQVKTALLGALAYFVLPADAMPDILPLLGYGDDALVLATALRMVSAHIRDEHREAARHAPARGLDEAR